MTDELLFETDPFDIPTISPPGCIFADDTFTVWCVVDPQDMDLTRHRWHVNQPHPTRNGSKRYFRRSRHSRGCYKPPVYLHVEIMKRVSAPPSKHHTLVDHRDGDEWNCRRYNLRWATISQNNKNRRPNRGAPRARSDFSQPTFFG